MDCNKNGNIWFQIKFPENFPHPSSLSIGCSLVLLDPVLQYFDTVKQLIFPLINKHSGLQIPLAFPGIGGEIQEDAENETFTQ